MRIALCDKKTNQIKSIRTIKSENLSKFVNKYSSKYRIDLDPKPFSKCRKFIKIKEVEEEVKLLRDDLPNGIIPIRIPDNVENILIVANKIGLGDVKSRLAGIQSLRKKYPNIKIGYMGPKSIIEILQNHPDVDYLLDSNSEFPQNAFIADLSDVAGKWETASVDKLPVSREEIYTLALSIEWNNEKPRLFITEEEAAFGLELIKSNECGKEKLGVVLKTAEIWKDWRYTNDFIDIAKEKFQVYTYDQSLKIDDQEIISISDKPIREVMSTLCYMDCVVTYDTAFHHLCEGLDIKCLALFGSMDVSRYSNRGFDTSVSFLQGRCPYDKLPCMYKVCSGLANYQPCMDSFSPSFILRKIEEILDHGKISEDKLKISK